MLPQVRQTSLPISLCLLLQVVLNQKFTDCFVLVFLDSHLGKTVRTEGVGLCVSLVGDCTPNALLEPAEVGRPTCLSLTSGSPFSSPSL